MKVFNEEMSDECFESTIKHIKDLIKITKINKSKIKIMSLFNIDVVVQKRGNNYYNYGYVRRKGKKYLIYLFPLVDYKKINQFLKKSNS